VSETASAAIHFEAYRKHREARNKVLGGSDFKAVLREYSEDLRWLK